MFCNFFIYFNHCSAIDQHKCFSQLQLCLEKHWVVNSGFKRIATTIFSKCTFGAYACLAFNHSLPSNHVLKYCLIQEFTPILVSEMLSNQRSKATKYNVVLNPSLPLQSASTLAIKRIQSTGVALNGSHNDSNNDSIASIHIEIYAIQSRIASL